MSFTTLLSYLIGSRAAILRIANTPNAVWLGAVFVLSAGLAREYDAKDLSNEPWYLVVPLGASLATSLLLFSLISVVGLRRNVDRRPFWRSYRSFLALYWMTAPLALIYALPVDRFLSVEAATATNLALLGIVSVWRVSLMTRVVTVYFGAGALAAFWLVMLFADTVALIILYLTPLPIFNIMGGIPLTKSEAMIQGAALWVGCLGAPAWFVWFFGVCAVYSGGKDWQPTPVESATNGRIDRSLWCLAAITILGWGLVLPLTQREQRLRHDVEEALAHGRIPEAIETMSRHEPQDFPPHWDAPPWLAYPNPRPPLVDVLEVVLDHDAAPWVRAIYVEKLESQLRDSWSFGYGWKHRDPTEKDRFLRVFERVPLVTQQPEEFQKMWASEDDADRKDRLRALLSAAGHEPEDPFRKPTSGPRPTPGTPTD